MARGPETTNNAEQGRLQLAQQLGFSEVNGVLTKELGGERYTFKRLTDTKDLEATTHLQQNVFFPDIPHEGKATETQDRDVCPGHMLATLNKLGGFVIGAYNAEGKLASFSYTWPTTTPGRYLLDMIGVEESMRDHNIGFEAMKALYVTAHEEGANEIVFTYEPLKVRNASIYVRKVGAKVTKYEIDPYGDSGLSGDRFFASWDISDTEHTMAVLSGELPTSNPEFLDVLPKIDPEDPNNLPEADMVLLPAPSDNDALSPEERTKWERFYRTVGERYFPTYNATQFITRNGDNGRENYYLLTKTPVGEQPEQPVKGNFFTRHFGLRR
ncbi:MAG TPA: hypothetical protein VF941_15195 [Clostridia bacterium]